MKQDQEKEKKQSNTTQSVVNNPERIKEDERELIVEIDYNNGHDMELKSMYWVAKTYEEQPKDETPGKLGDGSMIAGECVPCNHPDAGRLGKFD